ncbi:hypothetical protein HK101_005961 [Irineochytrium annulatum]|nr:hypothetical protein HK101_005961 [Irineochytrium annulatum]
MADSFCIIKPGTCNYDRGPDAVDPNNPTGAMSPKEIVYLKDPMNLCMNLPDLTQFPNKKPGVLQAEGHIQSMCIGDYKPPGSIVMPKWGLRSAIMSYNKHPNGSLYYQVYGTLGCDELGIECKSQADGGNSGQIDSVPYQYFGKEPYSSVDQTQNKGFQNYVMQAGDGIYCMRICQGGSGLYDPCNAKNDSAGCQSTMGIGSFPEDGIFTFTDNVGSLPPMSTSISIPAFVATTSLPATVRASSTAAAEATTTAAPVSTMPVAVTTIAQSTTKSSAFSIQVNAAMFLGAVACVFAVFL